MDFNVAPPPHPGTGSERPEAEPASLPVSSPAQPAVSTSPHTHGQGTACVHGGVHKSPSEEDVPLTIWASKVGTVHVHGAYSEHHPAHPPQHHNPHAQVNYAKAAKEEMDDVAAHPPGDMQSILHPGSKTGVEAWDQVNKELPSAHKRNDPHYRHQQQHGTDL